MTGHALYITDVIVQSYIDNKYAQWVVIQKFGIYVFQPFMGVMEACGIGTEVFVPLISPIGDRRKSIRHSTSLNLAYIFTIPLLVEDGIWVCVLEHI